MSAEAQVQRRASGQTARGRLRWLRARSRVAWRFLTARFSSSLTRRIVVLNLGGLVVLVVGFLLLDQFRADLIEARVQSLTIQADIIAAAISASATGDTDSITIDPDKLLQLAPGESVAPSPSDEDATQFSINPALVGPFLHRLVTPTRTRARIYDSDGRLLLDSRSFSVRGAVVRSDLPDASERRGFADRIVAHLRGWFLTSAAPRVEDPWATSGQTMPEVSGALHGKTQSLERVNHEGETIVSVGVPIQHMMATRGALLLSTQGGDIDRVITSARLAQLRFFIVLAVVMLVLSLSLANTIAEPVRRLADAAERVRRGIRSRQQIPDFTARSDEIGHLSRALREMTRALYSRLDAIESFAADVAHELKNPLTSLRSALETLPRVTASHSRDRLIAVMQHDVRRLDRLISDISDASRLDAELTRGEAEPVDVAALLRAVVSMAQDSPRAGARVELSIPVRRGKNANADYFVLGHDSRLAQVVTNLIDNASSFSEPGGVVRVALERTSARKEPEGKPFVDQLVITVDDDGPGIPPHALERIFERFYTDRPNQGFGQNSGLGLSISRQIVEAHGGRIWACNRPPELANARVRSPGRVDHENVEDSEETIRHGAGARFVVELPAFSA
jgi:two-component system, OmpR family, sensor histidine kinase ChvG